MKQDPFPQLGLHAAELSCRRGGRLIFKGVAFRLGSGEALAVTGRNGAGKSSLLALLLGRLRPETGAVTVEGAGEATLAELSHFVGHRDGLKSALTAQQNLAFAQALLGLPAQTPQAALEAVGLGHAGGLPVSWLSAGQRRRVALARLLVSARPFWLLDEPLAALDAGAQGLLAELMRGHLGAGGAILAATHGPLGLDEVRELRIGP